MIDLIEQGTAQDAILNLAVITTAIGMGEKKGTQKFIKELERAAGINGHADYIPPSRVDEMVEEGKKLYPHLFKMKATQDGR